MKKKVGYSKSSEKSNEMRIKLCIWSYFDNIIANLEKTKNKNNFMKLIEQIKCEYKVKLRI